jgi:hypothetical protein
MPRRPRLHVPGGFYHVTLQGNHHNNIFFRPVDCCLGTYIRSFVGGSGCPAVTWLSHETLDRYSAAKLANPCPIAQTYLLNGGSREKTMRATLALLIVLWTTPSFACMLISVIPVWATLDPALARPGDQQPVIRQVTVHSVMRGNADGPCSGGAAIVLAIPATKESRELAYSFETTTEIDGQVVFEPGPQEGNEKDGQLLFWFDWFDGRSVEQEPLDLFVLVTPFRRSGLAGKPIYIRVVDPGHD